MNRKISFIFRELIGSLADLGTLFPLLLGLIVCNGINAGTAFVLAGLTYIAAGIYYRIPMPVQPMKALAVIAITTGSTIGEIRAAAFLLAGILLILGVTRLADKLSDVFPKYLVHVIQLNLGVMMIRKGIAFILSYPASLTDFVPGSHHTAHMSAEGFFPSITDFRIAFMLLVLPQLPLTLGNAMLATRDCAQRYFEQEGFRATLSRLAVSMGIANAFSGIFAGIPICHGAGGMTAHYRMGAKTGAAGVMIGSLLLLFGILKSDSSMSLALVPAAVFGILLVYVGIRHALLAYESFTSPAMISVMLLSVIAGWFTNNLLIPLAVGLTVNLIFVYLFNTCKSVGDAANG